MTTKYEDTPKFKLTRPALVALKVAFLVQRLIHGKARGPFPARTYRLVRLDVARLRQFYPDEYHQLMRRYNLAAGELPLDHQLQKFHFDVRRYVGFIALPMEGVEI